MLNVAELAKCIAVESQADIERPISVATGILEDEAIMWLNRYVELKEANQARDEFEDNEFIKLGHLVKAGEFWLEADKSDQLANKVDADTKRQWGFGSLHKFYSLV